MIDILKEVNRCRNCKHKPCVKGCPINLPINDYIALVKDNKITEANELIRKTSMLPGICSLVCPTEVQCKGRCIFAKQNRSIKINEIENYIIRNTDYKHSIKNKIDKRVAIVGSGPSGIACAIYLARHGVGVTIFEKEKKIGGLLTYGIPKYRLPYDNLLKIQEELDYYGINVVLNKELKHDEMVKLKDDFDYVYIAIGLSKSKDLGIPNEDNKNVFKALEFLKEANNVDKFNENPTTKLNGATCVVGAGNVAMDAARMAFKMGSEKVYIVYRRSIDEAPCTKEELHEAKEDGVMFEFLKNPVKINLDDNDNITSITCEVMSLSEPDESGRKSVIGTKEFVDIKCDNVLKAIGQSPEILKHEAFELDYGYFKTDENNLTNIVNIYAGGDIVSGASTVVLATKYGVNVAKNILDNLNIDYKN